MLRTHSLKYTKKNQIFVLRSLPSPKLGVSLLKQNSEGKNLASESKNFVVLLGVHSAQAYHNAVHKT